MNLKETNLSKHKQVINEFGFEAAVVGIGALALSIFILRSGPVRKIFTGAAYALGGMLGIKIAEILNNIFTSKNKKWYDCDEIKNSKEQKYCVIYKLEKTAKYLRDNIDLECKLQDNPDECVSKIKKAIMKIELEIKKIKKMPTILSIKDMDKYTQDI